MPHEVAPSPLSGLPPVAATRPSRVPRWKLAKRSRFSAADLLGAESGGVPLADSLAAEAAAVPGTRLARGTRLGSPAIVVPAVAGA